MATKTLEVIQALTLLGSGRVEFPWGDPTRPYQCSLTDPLTIRRTFSIPASTGKVTLWDYTTEPMGFSLLAIKATGAFDLAIRADKPTSTTDFTPLGTHETWINIPLDCTLPFTLNSDDFLCNPTPADMSSDTADEPTAWGDAGTVRGLAYLIKARNTSSAAITGEIVLIGSR